VERVAEPALLPGVTQLNLRKAAVMLENEIVVGLDDSAAAQAALQWAARYARFTYTDVRVIHVPTCSVGASIAWSAGVPGIEGLFSPEPDNVQQLPFQHMFEAIDPEPGWVLEYRDGCPGPVLVTQSQDAQLLIVGTRKRARLPRLLSGSTSHFCLTHATCPVVAIHETEAQRGYASVQNGLRSRKRWRHVGSWTATSPQSDSDPIARFLPPPPQQW
jgi:nucleotide-binding universal stress UspA family protein